MQQPTASPSLESDQEYSAIEATLLASARGRWFLAEHGRRARRLDSALLEDAIGRLQTSLREPPALLGQLESEVRRLREFLASARDSVLANRTAASAANDAQPAAAILKAAEDLHEFAWSLQATQVDGQVCERIARNASSIYALSMRQAAESERAREFAAALERACTQLEGILETISHEAIVDRSEVA